MMASTYSADPRLLPLSKNASINVPQRFARVKGGAEGHYAQWVEACIAGHGKQEVSSPFEIAGPLTEALLMANLAIRGVDVQAKGENGRVTYPGRNIKLLWDNDNMKITNFDAVNQYVKREYRKGWTLGA
jgi:hypothetical protein